MTRLRAHLELGEAVQTGYVLALNDGRRFALQEAVRVLGNISQDSDPYGFTVELVHGMEGARSTSDDGSLPLNLGERVERTFAVKRVRRGPARAVAFGLGCIAGAHPRADRHIRQPLLQQSIADTLERLLKIALNVIGERLQGRDVEHPGRILEPPRETLSDEIVYGGEERREGLTGAGGRGEQGVSAGGDGGPRLALHPGGTGESAIEPGLDRRDEEFLIIRKLYSVLLYIASMGPFSLCPLR